MTGELLPACWYKYYLLQLDDHHRVIVVANYSLLSKNQEDSELNEVDKSFISPEPLSASE